MKMRVELLIALFMALAAPVGAADIYDAAVAHGGRTASDLPRDALDHPAELLRLAGIAPGMRVADVLAGSGYYSELLSYVVGPAGKVLLINNAAYDAWSDGLTARLAGICRRIVWTRSCSSRYTTICTGSVPRRSGRRSMSTPCSPN
jgi:predicted methyltransferase